LTQKNIVKSAVSYYHIIINKLFKQLLEEGEKMDYTEWANISYKYRMQIRRLTLWWFLTLILVIFSFLIGNLPFSGCCVFILMILTFKQVEAQYKLDNLKKPECFSIPERKPGESLHSYFSRIIAKLDGVDPDEVTPEYIQQQYEKRIYPNQRFYPMTPMSA
jgi:hypothetical protein